MLMKKIQYLMLALLFFTACEKDDTFDAGSAQELSTLQVKDIFYNCATLQGEYHPAGEKAAALGFALSLAPIDGSNAGTEYTVDEIRTGKFELRVEGLERKTDYYVKAFVVRNSGQRVYGNNIVFRTDSVLIDPPGAPTGTVTVLDGKRVSVSETGTTLGDERLTTEDRRSTTVKPGDYGIYYWTDEEGRDNARKFSLGEPLSNLNAISDEVVYEVEGLKPDTKYNYVLYIRTGVYFNGDKWKSFSKEVEGDAGTFRTKALETPAVSTGEVSDVTPTSLIIAGVLDFNGYDPDARFGIEYGQSSVEFSDKAYALSLEDESNDYKVFVKGLSPNTKYYYRAFVENDVFSAVGSAVNSFTTDSEGNPVVDEYLLDYDFRAANFSTSSVVLRAKLLSDGGAVLTGKGFLYGTSPEALDRKLEVTGAIVSDGMYDYFEGKLADIPEGTVYYKPFAANAHGETVYGKVCQIHTAVSGGALYMLDLESGQTPAYKNMVYSGTQLVYYELDPIRSGNTTYYMLDRNVGATTAYGEHFYDKAFDTGITYPELFEAAGYYYQFDRAIPSATPDVKVVTNMSSIPWRWTQSEAMFDDPPMNLKGDEWTVDNCPEGYSMATTEDLTAIVNALEPTPARQTLSNLFKATRFGTTGWRAPANGNMTNGSLVTCDLWCADAGTPKGTGKNTGAYIMRIGAPPTGRFSITSASTRFTGRPIRCLRKVTTDTGETSGLR